MDFEGQPKRAFFKFEFTYNKSKYHFPNWCHFSKGLKRKLFLKKNVK